MLVASDAVGLGLNLNIARIILTTTEKFDGAIDRRLDPSEIKQVRRQRLVNSPAYYAIHHLTHHHNKTPNKNRSPAARAASRAASRRASSPRAPGRIWR